MKPLLILFTSCLLFTSGTLIGQEIEAVSTPSEEPTPVAEEIFRLVEQMPTFPGCENETDKNKRQQCAQRKMLEFVYSHLQYPVEAKAQRLEGTVVILFVVEKDGRISNPEVIQDIGGGCGDAALKIVEQMPVWNPGKQRNQARRVYFSLPIRFKLEKIKSKKRK